MEQELWVTKLVNLALAKPAAALLAALGRHPDPRAPIPNHVAMELFVFLIAAIFLLWLRPRLSADRPGGVQWAMEYLITNPWRLGVKDMLEDFLGHGGETHMAIIGSIGLFILFSNLISLIPTLESPTAVVTVPLGCALFVFVYYHWSGIRKQGAGKYGKQFLGPLPLMVDVLKGLPGWVKFLAGPVILLVGPFMPIVELFSHCARILSLTARLWANMLASETIYVQFLAMSLGLALFCGKFHVLGYPAWIVPVVVPTLFVGLHIFVAFIQAFVFTILPVIYVGGAVAEHH
ncbi:MAG TPA: FoF1 ATP synthase subunit a [Candidatus Acidoferrales bacterium]|nr:FoF1 ATP synthase subunit a [Candidatus Acidoferrales bacterium]